MREQYKKCLRKPVPPGVAATVTPAAPPTTRAFRGLASDPLPRTPRENIRSKTTTFYTISISVRLPGLWKEEPTHGWQSTASRDFGMPTPSMPTAVQLLRGIASTERPYSAGRGRTGTAIDSHVAISPREGERNCVGLDMWRTARR